MASLRELVRVRVLLFLREPEALFWVFAFPLILAAVLGFAFRSAGLPASRVGVLAGPDQAALLERLRATPHLEAIAADDPARARKDLRRGRFDVLVEPADVPHLVLDPDRPDSETARLRVLAVLSAPPGDGEPAPAVLEPVRERGSRYVDFLFPGLLGMNLMGTGMWSIGFAIAELRQRKLLRRLLVTPMRRSSFLASFLIGRLVFLVLEVGVLLAFGRWGLDVPQRAALPGLALLILVGALSFSGLGLLTVARVKTIQGASGILNLVMMPMWLGAGVFFSYERFPEFLHPVLRLIPLTSLNDALRALMLDGDPLTSQWRPLAVLSIWGALSFLVALKLFRWE